MKIRKFWVLVLAVSLQSGLMLAQEKRDKEVEPRKFDIGKMTVELPLINRIGTSAFPASFGPTKLNSRSKARIGQKASVFKNPAVRPGHIRWHANFKKAQGKSLLSGKPIFIFYLMGKLNEKFT